MKDAKINSSPSRKSFGARPQGRRCPSSICILFFVIYMSQHAAHGATSRLRCEPSTLRVGETLTLRIRTPHGREFGVRTPTGRFLFIAFHPESGRHVNHPPIPSSAFLGMKTVRLPISSAMAVDLPADSAPEHVFTSAGIYRFVVSDNLETEDEGHANLWCTVHFLAGSSK
jgi:hypothetical protein